MYKVGYTSILQILSIFYSNSINYMEFCLWSEGTSAGFMECLLARPPVYLVGKKRRK